LFADFYGLSLGDESAATDITDSNQALDPAPAEAPADGAKNSGENSESSDSESKVKHDRTRSSSFNSEHSTGVVDVSQITDAERLNLDHPAFDANLYLQTLMKEHGIKFLANLDSQMVAQKKSLDGAMQMLVYENYNKFIDATDKMKEMKDKVSAMEGEMKALLAEVNKVASTCDEVEMKLAPNRASVENLVGRSRLLHKLEFLFEMPGRLKRSVEIGALPQAVQYYKVSDAILRQHQHLPSFGRIRQESEIIIASLRTKLRGELSDCRGDASTQMERVGMLVDLGAGAEALLDQVLAARRLHFKAVTAACVAHTKRMRGEALASPSKADAKHLANSYTGSTLDEGSDPVLALQSSVIDPLLLFCDCFSAGLEKVCQPASDPAVRRILQRATRGLGELAQSAVGDYVTEVREELLLRAELRPGPRSGANPETTPTPVPMREAVEALVSTLKSVYGCVRQVDQRLPNPALVERVSAVCMECVRKCGESVCDRTQKHLSKVLLTSHQAVKRFHRFHTLRRRSCLSLTVVAAHLSPGKLAALCRPADGSSGSPQLSVSVWLDDKVGEAQRTGTAALTGRDGKRVSARALPVDGDNAGSLAWNQSLEFPLASVHDTLRLKLAVEAFAPGSGSESAADPAASGSVASFPCGGCWPTRRWLSLTARAAQPLTRRALHLLKT